MSVPVEYDTRVNGQVVTCLSKSGVWYRSIKVCCHTVAIANKLNVLSTLISKLDPKQTIEQALMNSTNVRRDKNCGKKKTKATQNRKGRASNKPQKIAKLLPLPDRAELELSQPPSSSQNMPIQYQQNLMSNNLFISQILFYNFLHLRILLPIFRHQQEIQKTRFKVLQFHNRCQK